MKKCKHLIGHGYNKKHKCMEIIFLTDDIKNYLDNISLTRFKFCPLCGGKNKWIQQKKK